jgi:hypothetical protein
MWYGASSSVNVRVMDTLGSKSGSCKPLGVAEYDYVRRVVDRTHVLSVVLCGPALTSGLGLGLGLGLGWARRG